MQYDVLILGAGVSGLSAAGALRAAGCRVGILEARERLGGRILTHQSPFSATPAELGAEFVHGRPEVIFEAAARGETPLAIQELDWRRTVSAGGELRPGDEDDSGASIGRLHQQIDPDRHESYAAFLDRVAPPPKVREAARAYVEGFHAAEATRIAAAAVRAADDAEAACEGDRIFRVAAGYHALVKKLAAGLSGENVFLNTVAEQIHWHAQAGDGAGAAVRITARSRGGFALPAFEASQLLVTLPVGVLQAKEGTEGAVSFQPALPSAKLRALAGLAMGDVARITLHLRREFWDELERRHGAAGKDLEFVQSGDPVFPVWWTAQPVQTNRLTAWVGGSNAQQLLARGADAPAIVQETIAACSRVFGVAPALVEHALLDWHYHDWSRDHFSRGAYSYLTAGNETASRELAQPIDGRLFFAGEATHWEGENGTVHGAIASGERAAREILSQRQADGRR